MFLTPTGLLLTILNLSLLAKQSIGLRCPISIRQADSSETLSPQNLVDAARNSTRLELVFINQNFANQSQSLSFYPNRDLLGNSLQDVPSSSTTQGHLCHFESVTAEGGHNALSACSMELITGNFKDGRKSYILSQENDQFYLIPQGNVTCDWGHSRRKRADHQSSSIPNYYDEYIDQTIRYVELVFIADNSIYVKYDKNETKVHDRLQSVANVVNSLYAPLNIRVTLVWADIWKNGDVFEVTADSDTLISQFLDYRKTFLPEHPHDVAQFVTDVKFDGRTIGKAYMGTMCSYDYSGGVIMDHSNFGASVASTSAHELGHNFGMEHDKDYPQPCQCSTFPKTSCIMAPSSEDSNYPTVWSDCSLNYLKQSYKRGIDSCLHNVPKKAFGGAKCGNGIVEEGEDCDCGGTEKCPNKCCIASTCKLAEGATCASGECCDIETCQPKPKATVCRDSTNSCDLPEFCDGQTQHCPGDFFVQNGLPCPDDPDDFCYEGECGSREKQCQLIWGPASKNSVPKCYAYNSEGSVYGNCGFNTNTKNYFGCRSEDNLCGRLQCHHLSEKPEIDDRSIVETAYRSFSLSNGTDVFCRTIRTTYTGTKKTDPGMVPDGAKCGENKMCIDSKCTNHSKVVELVPKCDPKDCSNHGICNNMGNCHCEYGYGGVGCNVPGYGGSVNSGPAYTSTFNPLLWVVGFLVLIMIAFIVATVYCKKRKNLWLHEKIWQFAKKHLNLHSILVPVRKAPPPPRRVPPPDLNSVWEDTPQNVIHVTKPIIPSTLKLKTVIQPPKSRQLAYEYAIPYQSEYTVPHNDQIPPGPVRPSRSEGRQPSNAARPKQAPTILLPHGKSVQKAPPPPRRVSPSDLNSKSRQLAHEYATPYQSEYTVPHDDQIPPKPVRPSRSEGRQSSNAARPKQAPTILLPHGKSVQNAANINRNRSSSNSSDENNSTAPLVKNKGVKSIRPNKMLLPPLHRKPNFDEKNKPRSPKEKPQLPKKSPVVANPVNVKSLAAKFDVKKANV
uniref:Uncharacterized protein n=1 Tax=Acrobeloides nanus TaxID=290746 RepID=A0A914ENZ5_9BILA